MPRVFNTASSYVLFAADGLPSVYGHFLALWFWPNWDQNDGKEHVFLSADETGYFPYILHKTGSGTLGGDKVGYVPSSKYSIIQSAWNSLIAPYGGGGGGNLYLNGNSLSAGTGGLNPYPVPVVIGNKSTTRATTFNGMIAQVCGVYDTVTSFQANRFHQGFNPRDAFSNLENYWPLDGVDENEINLVTLNPGSASNAPRLVDDTPRPPTQTQAFRRNWKQNQLYDGATVYHYRYRDTLGVLDSVAALGALDVTQLAFALDGSVGHRRLSETHLEIDGAVGERRVSNVFFTTDVQSWLSQVYAWGVTDTLGLWDSNFGRTVFSVNWDIWSQGDYYREVAALMRIESFTPFRYPLGPLRDVPLGITDWVVSTRVAGFTPPTPTFVQSTAYRYSNTQPLTVGLNNVQSGNLVVVVLGEYGTMTATCYDSLGNSWTLVGSLNTGTTYWDCAWMSFISNPGSMIISARHGGSYPTLHAFEFSGVNTLYQKTTIKSGGTTICATQTLDSDVGLIVTALHWGNNVTLTSMQPDVGFTHIRSIAQNNGPIGIGVAYRVTTVAGAYPSGWTTAPTNMPLGEFALAFKFVQV